MQLPKFKNVDYHPGVSWKKICAIHSPDVVPLLENHYDKIDWYWLSSNPFAIPIIEENIDKIQWVILSLNRNAVHILKQYPHKIKFDMLCTNPYAIDILEQNLDNIDASCWFYLSQNPNAIPIIKNNMDKIWISMLYENPNAYCLMKTPEQQSAWKNGDHTKVTVDNKVCAEQNIYQYHFGLRYDYVAMLNTMRLFCEELVSIVYHPLRVARMSAAYDVDFDTYLDLLDPQ